MQTATAATVTTIASPQEQKKRKRDMLIHSLYIYDRLGNCLYQKDWFRPRKTNSDVEDQKLMYGMYYSLRAFCKTISPIPGCAGFSSYSTKKYKLSYFETLSGYKFILTTDPGAGDLKEVFQYLYGTIFVENVTMSPRFVPGGSLDGNAPFVEGVDKFIRSAFSVRP
eukprot:ANDGO_03922.mRNA.1 Trafficking protein particle complex subunit 1